MSEHQIPIEEANTNLLSCAAYLAEDIRSSDGHAEAMLQIVPRYLEKGDVDLAAALADAVDDPFVRDRLLTLVAEKCAAIDDDEYAFQLVEAIEDEGSQRQARERIALQKSAKNEFEKARAIADELEHPDNVFADIAFHQSAQNDEASALATLEQIEFPYAKAVALQNIALFKLQKDEAEAAVQYLEKAAQAADEIEYTEEQIRAFTDIANHFAEAKRNDRAIEFFDKAKTIAENLDNIHRDTFLSAISLGFLRAGSVDLADRTLDLVADKTQMTSALVGFSQVYNEKGEREDALETLEEAYAILKSQKDLEIRSSKNRYTLWSGIAVLFARYEKPERAIEIAQEITDETEQISALSQIAQSLSLQGNDAAAQQSFNAIHDDSQRLFALIGVSDAQNRLEKRAEAVRYLDEAAHLAEAITQLAPRSTAFIELARRFNDYGETARAREISHENLETIAQIRDESNRAVSLVNFAELYEQADFDLTDEEKTILKAMTKQKDW
jgi:tetratricopeptide (TPR) repeat protein